MRKHSQLRKRKGAKEPKIKRKESQKEEENEKIRALNVGSVANKPGNFKEKLMLTDGRCIKLCDSLSIATTTKQMQSSECKQQKDRVKKLLVEKKPKGNGWIKGN